MDKNSIESVLKNYSIANLYINLDKISDRKTLTFYKRNNKTLHRDFGKRIYEIEFESFNSAYKFILENNIKVYNISCGSYAKEIANYNKKIRDTGQLLLF